MTEYDDQVTKFVRLKNGEDIVTQLIEVSEGELSFFTFINPLKVLYLQSEKTGNLQLAFIPWVFPKVCELQEFDINPEDIMFVSNASTKMNKYYWDNLDHYLSMYEGTDHVPETAHEETQEEANPEESIRELIEALQNSKRTYH